MTKTYKADNVNEVVLSFLLGKAVVKCSFTGGRDNVPAKFTTSDLIVQVAIENDGRFGRTILMDRVVGEEKEDVLSKKEARGEVELVEDVNDVNGVIEWLKNAGVAHQSLRSVKNIRKVMEERNVGFPNVIFPEE